jgi:TonB family protein
MKSGGMPCLIVASLLLHVAAVVAVMNQLAAKVPASPPLQSVVVVEQLVTEEWIKSEPVPAALTVGPPQRPTGGVASPPVIARPVVTEVSMAAASAATPLATTAASAPLPAKATAPQQASPEDGRHQVKAPRLVEGAVVAATRPTGGGATSPAGAPHAGRNGVAAGSGNSNDKAGGGHGTIGRSAASMTPSGIRAQASRNYQAVLKRMIEARKEYPLASRRRREEGSCQRRLVLARDGSLRRVEAVSRCGHAFLDEAATRAITSVGKFPPLPNDIEGGEAIFTIAIAFTLASE